MPTITSADGTSIAYDRLGAGPPLIIVGGLMCDRARSRPTAEALARHFMVLNYDRRGRAESGDTPPYAIAREIDDLAALIDAADGAAAVYGHSSGAGLILHAAAAGLPISRIVLHEPPYNPDDAAAKQETRAFAARLAPLLRAGRRGDAVDLFWTTMGLPQEAIIEMRRDPAWAEMEAMAPTIAYDSEIMGDRLGGTVPTHLLGSVTAPALVLVGGASPDWMAEVGREIVAALPNGRLCVLPDQEHIVPPEILAPVLAEFLAA